MLCVHCGAPGADKGSMQHPYCTVCWSEVWKNDIVAYTHWLAVQHSPEPADKPFQLPASVVQHKCIATQGAGFMNMMLIFFMGASAIQNWLEKHQYWAPDIGWLIMGVVLGSWCVGRVLLGVGMIGEEQAWYSERNRVFDSLRKKDKGDRNVEIH